MIKSHSTILVLRLISTSISKTLNPNFPEINSTFPNQLIRQITTTTSTKTTTVASPRSPSISIWRRKKEIGKEGLIIAKEMKRLQSNPVRLHKFMQTHVSRLLKSDLVSVLFEFQRQDQVFLSMKLYEVVRKEIWYRPDMFFYRDMLMMLARNKKVEEAKRVWVDLKQEQVLFDQHTFGDIIRAFLDNGLPDEAMYIYDEMRQSPDPPLSLPYRVIMKGLFSYPELREKIKADFLELFPDPQSIRWRIVLLYTNFICSSHIARSLLSSNEGYYYFGHNVSTIYTNHGSLSSFAL